MKTTRSLILMAVALASGPAYAQYTDGVVKIGVLTDMSSLYADNTGPGSVAAAKLAVHMMLGGGYISEYDALVARKLGNILAGGALTSAQLVSEQYLLDLEREAFVSLCGERKTQERIAHTLKTGKPLRN